MQKSEMLEQVEQAVSEKLTSAGLPLNHLFRDLTWDDAMVASSDYHDKTNEPKYEKIALIFLHGSRLYDNVNKSYFVLDLN